MRKSWPWGIPSYDIELRIGSLLAFFGNGNSEWLASVLLGTLVGTVGGIFFYLWLTIPNWNGAWPIWAMLWFFSLVLLAVAWWYCLKRKYFAICTEGCAYGASRAAPPQMLQWSEITTIQLVEEASLDKQEHSILGLQLSVTMKEITKRSLLITSSNENMVIKLKDFPKSKKLLEQLVEHTADKEFQLDHARLETPDLVEAKAAGHEANFGKTKMTALGIVLVIVFIIIKVVAGMMK